MWACPFRSGYWSWSVLKDGLVIGSGVEPTREIAEQEADEVLSLLEGT